MGTVYQNLHLLTPSRVAWSLLAGLLLIVPLASDGAEPDPERKACDECLESHDEGDFDKAIADCTTAICRRMIRVVSFPPAKRWWY